LVGADLDVMTASMIAAVDQHIADAYRVDLSSLFAPILFLREERTRAFVWDPISGSHQGDQSGCIQWPET
jgi:hypothetical protein